MTLLHFDICCFIDSVPDCKKEKENADAEFKLESKNSKCHWNWGSLGNGPEKETDTQNDAFNSYRNCIYSFEVMQTHDKSKMTKSDYMHQFYLLEQLSFFCKLQFWPLVCTNP